MTYLHLPICISGINIRLFDEEFKMWPNIYDIGFCLTKKKVLSRLPSLKAFFLT